MPVLIDFNPLIISAVYVAQNNLDAGEDLSVDFVRHEFLNRILSLKRKFSSYGKVVICCDAKNSWRKEIFPYYKASRKKSREDSPINWQVVYEAIDLLRKELDETFPYKVVSVDRAEADDIIGTLVRYFQTHELEGTAIYQEPQKIMIVSGDKDFKQLQMYRNVEQFSPAQDKLIAESRPDLFLREHIIRGDTSDGVPNIFSDDDVFVVQEKRQKPVMQKKLDVWLECEDLSFLTEEVHVRNYYRNKKLVDLAEIPDEIQDDIVRTYINASDKKRDMFNYFIKHRLKNLMGEIANF